MKKFMYILLSIVVLLVLAGFFVLNKTFLEPDQVVSAWS